MNETNLKLKTIELLQKVKYARLSQERLAIALSVSQSQISRVLSGKGKRQTKLFDELCIYVNNQIKGVSPDLVRENTVLLEAIASVWDGSTTQAYSIAAVIKSLGPLCKSNVLNNSTINLNEMRE